ncbi:BsuPI-related putative proteinase inhibitor [Lentibacillus saliphilus]|uniref:BsuPI-related putative proteinase inhibitor n=1 Tax=Lentibacillus saliphilus TaxID=2737028 RepID=UPI001C2FF9EF|nr:BsuPI-related putative proteinase inhibitor [Lentibacillus saliphilus]
MKKISLSIVLILVTVLTLVITMTSNVGPKEHSQKQIDTIGKDDNEMRKKKIIKQKFNPGENSSGQNLDLDFNLNLLDGQTKALYSIENTGNNTITLHFTTSQLYDYEITDANQNLVYKYSDGKRFLQVLKDERIEPGESLEYEIMLPKLEKGRYTLVVYSAAKDLANSRETLELEY